MVLIKPIVEEQWVVGGVATDGRPIDVDALYIKPLLQDNGLLCGGRQVFHSLVLDSNVFTDLIEERLPANNRFLEKLVKNTAIELNPTFAIIEQRQKFSQASEALLAYVEYVDMAFGYSLAKQSVAHFETSLAIEKQSLTSNIDLLSGYLSAIVYLYHQPTSAEEKLKWLSGLVTNADLPFFQLHYYFAALVFLVKQSPDLFNSKDVEKVVSDMKLERTIEKHKKKILNLSNDLALPTMALFPSGVPSDVLVFPYIATRDRLVQLFLSQVTCQFVSYVGGRPNGSWRLKEGYLLHEHLGNSIEQHLPQRHALPSKEDMAVRKSRLQAFSDLYVRKSVELKSFHDRSSNREDISLS